MKYLPLNQGEFTIVDDEDFYRFQNVKLWKKSGKRFGGYALMWFLGRETRLHRLIINCPRNFEVDHINGNRLDNRKENLRICSHAENCINVSKRKNVTSQYLGVSRLKNNKLNPWVAIVFSNKKKYHIGCFPTELSAAMARDMFAKEINGEFARLNFQV